MKRATNGYVLSELAASVVLDAFPHVRRLLLRLPQYHFVECQNVAL